MRAIDAQARIKELAASLDVAAFLAKMREFEKGGLPGQSMSDGRGGDSPCPIAEKPRPKDAPPWKAHSDGEDHPDRVLGVRDPTDREIRRDRLLVEQDLRHAAVALTHASQIVNAWTIPRTDDTEKAKQLEETKAGTPCANVACDRWMTGTQDNRPRHIDGLALCEKCYRFQRRTGKRWTPALEALEASA